MPHPAAARLQELLRSQDPDLIAQGVELLITLDDPALFADALVGCRVLPGGALQGSRAFPGQEGHPFHADILGSLLTAIAHLPPAAPVHPSLHPAALESLRLAVQPPLHLPAALGRLPHLKRLSLSRNHLSGLPDDLPILPHLTQLDLSHNALTTVPVTALRRLPALAALDLSFNPVAHVPPEIRQLHGLTVLRLVGARLTTLPPDLAALEQLRTLDLSRCDGLRALPAAVLALPRLETLSLRSVPLRLEVEQILQMPALRTLHVSRGSYPRDATEVRRTLQRLRPELRLSL